MHFCIFLKNNELFQEHYKLSSKHCIILDKTVQSLFAKIFPTFIGGGIEEEYSKKAVRYFFSINSGRKTLSEGASLSREFSMNSRF